MGPPHLGQSHLGLMTWEVSEISLPAKLVPASSPIPNRDRYSPDERRCRYWTLLFATGGATR